MDPYYCLEERILLELKRRELLPDAFSSSLGHLPELYPLIKRTGILARAHRGYDGSDVLEGIVVDAIDQSGTRLVFLGLSGWYVSNDHRPFYELLFSSPATAPTLRFVKGQRFFYDVAGLEGVEWYVMWPYLSIIAIAGLIVFIPALAIRTRTRTPRLCVNMRST